MLDSETLLYAYSRGVFPMAHDDGVYWYDPDPRAILPLEGFHVPRSLQRVIKRQVFDIRVDSAFRRVMEECAAPAPGRESTWISSEFITAYTWLHRLGYAHSVETWQDDLLVGGLYGVAVNGLFAGESMFSRSANAGKVALVYLVQRLRNRRFELLDVQFSTAHLRQFGVIEISRAEYRRRLALAISKSVRF